MPNLKSRLCCPCALVCLRRWVTHWRTTETLTTCIPWTYHIRTALDTRIEFKENKTEESVGNRFACMSPLVRETRGTRLWEPRWQTCDRWAERLYRRLWMFKVTTSLFHLSESLQVWMCCITSTVFLFFFSFVGLMKSVKAHWCVAHYCGGINGMIKLDKTYSKFSKCWKASVIKSALM